MRILKAEESENQGAEVIATLTVNPSDLLPRIGFEPDRFEVDGLH